MRSIRVSHVFFSIAILFLLSFVDMSPVRAAVLSPGTITTCGDIYDGGTYTLGANLSTTTQACLIIRSPGSASGDIVIDGGGTYSITGDIIGDGIQAGDQGSGFTLQDLTLIGGVTSVGANSDDPCTISGGNGGEITLYGSSVDFIDVTGGNDSTGDCGAGIGGYIYAENSSLGDIISYGGSSISGNPGNLAAGNGGDVTLVESDFNSITVTGGDNTSGGNGGNGGTVTLTVSGKLGLSDHAIEGGGGVDGDSVMTGSAGTLDLTYSTIETNAGTFVYSMNVVSNTVSWGFWNGLFAPPHTGPITSASDCTVLLAGQIYTLANNITGDCRVSVIGATSTGVTIDGAGYTITGNFNADAVLLGDSGASTTLKNITITGSTTANGTFDPDTDARGNGGTIVLVNATTTTVAANVGLQNPNSNIFTFSLEDYLFSSAGRVYVNNSTTTTIALQGGNGLIYITNSSVGGVTARGAGGSIVIASSTAGAISADNDGYGTAYNGGNIVITNSTTSNITTNGHLAHRISGFGVFVGGNGGNVTVTDSSFGNITANAAGNNKIGGNITVTATDVDLSNKTLSATGNTNGVLTINYTTFEYTNLILSAFSSIILNGPGGEPGNVGSFGGGTFVLGTIINSASECNLGFSRTYVLGADITGDCVVSAENVVIDGNGHSISGSISGDGTGGHAGYSFTLKNMTVGGVISSRGSIRSPAITSVHIGNGGSITIQNSTTSDIIATGPTCIYLLAATCGTGGTVTIENSTTTNIFANGGNLETSYYNGASSAGQGGTVSISTSTTGSVYANGGNGDAHGGAGGMITLTNSRERVLGASISANGGDALVCGYGGSGGTVNSVSSTYTGGITTNPGLDMTANCTSGNTPLSGSSGNQGTQNVSQSSQTAPAPESTQTDQDQTPVTSVPVQSQPTQNAAPSGSTSSGSSQPSAEFLKSIGIDPSTVEVPSTLSTIVDATVQVSKKVVDTATVVVDTPAAKTVQTLGFLSGLFSSMVAATESAFASTPALSELSLVFVRLWGAILGGLGIRKRSRPWGTVYDSVTKQPIDPAIVTARDGAGNVVAESVTDIDGRYGFLLPDGIYYLSAKKTHYEFPSKKLGNKSEDELYNELYYGGPVEVKGGEVLGMNIPLDQAGFDWNEQNKRDTHALSFHSQYERSWAKVVNYLYGLGLIVSVVATAIHPHTYNVVVLVLYALVILSVHIFSNRRKVGFVRDVKNNLPLSYAIIRVTSTDHETVLRSCVSDVLGRYYCIVPKGQYYVDIDKKNADGSYTKVYTSKLITSDTGILNSSFDI